MCGRYDLEKPELIYTRFKTRNLLPEISPNTDVRPAQMLPVVYENGKDTVVELMKWGLVPFWAKDPKIGNKMINARAEGITDKPSFRNPFHRQRVIVPATGFYEWKKTDSGKVKCLFTLPDQEMFGFAGLSEIWRDKDGKALRTFTIITTEPNSLVGEVHNRMPVILKDQEAEKTWLDLSSETEDLLSLLASYPANKMEVREAS